MKLRALPFYILAVILIIGPSFPCIAEDQPSVNQRSGISAALKKIGSVLGRGLSKIPSAAQAAAARGRNASQRQSNTLFTPRSTSGTPPTLDSIADSLIENLFWRPDVVSSIAQGSSSQVQCSEFFTGTVDGHSGGLRICELAQGIGFSFQNLLRADITLCYMKALPTQKNLRSGAVTISTGRNKIPGGDFTRLFAPGKTPRTVRIHVPAINQINSAEKDIFVKLRSNTQNQRSGLLYDAAIYSCLKEAGSVADTTRLTVDDSGQISIRTGEAKVPITDGSMDISVKGFLRPSSDGLAWDLSRKRSISIQSLEREAENFKSSIVITPDNLLSIKRRNSTDSVINQEFSSSQFAGDSALSFRFLAGAFKAAFISNDGTTPYSGAAEYRDSYYAAAPASSLVDKVSQFKLDADSFFQTDPTIASPPVSYSCSVRADVELELDGSNQTLLDSLMPCAQNVLTDMDFCSRSALVNSALQNFSDSCL